MAGNYEVPTQEAWVYPINLNNNETQIEFMPTV